MTKQHCDFWRLFRATFLRKAHKPQSQNKNLNNTPCTEEDAKMMLYSKDKRPHFRCTILRDLYIFDYLEETKPVLRNVMEALADPDIHLIGVYSSHCHYKEALLERVYTRIHRDHLFDKILTATVTRKPDVKKIQEEIACQLGLTFNHKSKDERAQELIKRLKIERLKTEQKILIVLCDLYKGLDLVKVGILCGSDCKILLTSTTEDVLSNQMHTQINFTEEGTDKPEKEEVVKPKRSLLKIVQEKWKKAHKPQSQNNNLTFTPCTEEDAKMMPYSRGRRTHFRCTILRDPYIFHLLEQKKPVLRNVMEALADPDIHLIGVYSSHCHYKVALLERVYTRIHRDRLFDKILTTTVTRKPDVKKIQEEIACQLGLTFSHKSKDERAKELFERLKIEHKILIVLCDLYKGLDLVKVGIPYGSYHTGCKILLTSTTEDVLSNQMHTQINFTEEDTDKPEKEEAVKPKHSLLKIVQEKWKKVRFCSF